MKRRAWDTFWKLEKFCRSTSISFNNKVGFFNTSCLIVLLCDPWILHCVSVKMENEIDAFATSWFRIMLGIKKPWSCEKYTNLCIRWQTPSLSSTFWCRLLCSWMMIQYDEYHKIRTFTVAFKAKCPDLQAKFTKFTLTNLTKFSLAKLINCKWKSISSNLLAQTIWYQWWWNLIGKFVKRTID